MHHFLQHFSLLTGNQSGAESGVDAVAKCLLILLIINYKTFNF